MSDVGYQPFDCAQDSPFDYAQDRPFDFAQDKQTVTNNAAGK